MSRSQHRGEGGRRGSGQFRPGDGAEASLSDIWPEYLSDGYFDETGQLRVEFVARSRVEKLAKELGTARLTTHQLRRFFGHCRRLETRLRSAGEIWRQVEADFLKLDAAAADAAGKRPAKIPRLFHDFIRTNVAAVKKEKDFLQGFVPHFEALVGFASGKLQERN